MKSIVAFLLAGLILGSSLLPGFGVEQSTKLVELIQHYQQHEKASPGLSFTDFMVMHYGENSEHQKHPNHSHHNLPSVGHMVTGFTSNGLRLSMSSYIPVVLASQKAFSRYTNLYSFLSVFSLINPPRR
ncbi:hypothetical protein EXU85_06280 [Spirosoma sp. KCTC 42546]|uniref:hypothetical protein n=1 Tax=Spirosoma sp. KCTC 42546 TaxID=2520506 RepID=UPI001158CB94|nr:hypothetical protein [Spirosoma sp. KCTC 42546]QDK78225.1 hypothetical protein EXU85_06280 [Spirosoma sp. KCTC 42546]